jgi:Uma2 family endonuclease
MATLLKIGPADHGKPLTYEDFVSADWEEGYQYELIDGKLYVSPTPNLPQDFIEAWLYKKFLLYQEQHPEVIQHLSNKGRVFVPDRPGVTNPEPDLALYDHFPRDRPFDQVRWEEISPFLVVEVLSLADPAKDLVRNVELYLQVPSIREYWILDSRQSALQPMLYVRRRRGSRWQRVIEVPYGETYTTRLLPGFELRVDPRW